MYETQNTEQIEVKDLLTRVQDAAGKGYRLVQISSTNKKEYIEVNYTFDDNYAFSNLRMNVPMDKLELPSISGIFWGAFIYENELHDLFGINISGINIDFKGKFYQTAVKTPFNNPACK
jgi:ech hydrogenase subunit D